MEPLKNKVEVSKQSVAATLVTLALVMPEGRRLAASPQRSLSPVLLSRNGEDGGGQGDHERGQIRVSSV